jgi:uncharacterized membrane protein
VEQAGGGGPSTLAWVIFALVLVLLLLAIASLVIDAYYRRRGSQPVAASTPGPAPGPAKAEALSVLDGRYARGEVQRDEYLQARDDLRGTAEATTQEIPPTAEPEPA